MTGRIVCAALVVVIAAALVVLGVVVTGVLESVAQCGGDLLRSCR